MNFSPRFLNSKIILSNKKINKIYSRNFIFTILIFDMFKSDLNLFKKDFNPLNYKFFIFKKRKNVGSILRAPYKNKAAQFSLGLYRYYLILSFYVNNNNIIKINNIEDFKILLRLVNSYNYFESALITQVSRTLNFPIKINIL